ncbi:hypothetical protein CY35_02G057600 [Sphagnum magellanicum]|nr:hypothetical protein CY35_02G057600 [Sphagnum magellanicum]
MKPRPNISPFPFFFYYYWLLILVCCAPAASAYRGSDGERCDERYASIRDVAVGEPVTLRMLEVDGYVESSPGLKPEDLSACTRVRIPGQSRLKNIGKFADTMRVIVDAVEPSHAKVELCFHKNASLGLAQCAKESWQLIEKGSWTGVMSPFETRFLDIRTLVSPVVSLDISVQEEQRVYRLVFLALGMTLLLMAPVVSSWVPFYYSSAMTLGVLLVVLVLLYQGMKLLPTGRKSTMYIVLYGSMVGLGTVLLNYFSGLLSTVLMELGFGEDMFSPVAIFVSVAIGLIGAWLGFWGVRKLVLSEDGRVDAGTATFVKWAIRIVGCVMLLQTSHDPVFALLALVLGSTIAWLVGNLQLENIEFVEFFHGIWSDYVISSWKWILGSTKKHYVRGAVQRPSSLHTMKQGKKQSNDKSNRDRLRNLPTKEGLALWQQVAAVSERSVCVQKIDGASKSPGKEFFSTFHNSPHIKPLSKEEYKATAITEKAVDDLITSAEFKEWAHSAAENDRISIVPNEEREEREEDEIEQTADMESFDYFSRKYAANRRSF